ncbi:MAG: hypothetical protein HQK52_15240 [Oligoflexia bacterium]|nr:hypothetical protein [Oligoflexia bacterium]
MQKLMKDKKLQYQALKKISPAKRVSIALDLIYSARELKRAALRLKYKDATPEEIDAKLKELIRYATT